MLQRSVREAKRSVRDINRGMGKGFTCASSPRVHPGRGETGVQLLGRGAHVAAVAAHIMQPPIKALELAVALGVGGDHEHGEDEEQHGASWVAGRVRIGRSGGSSGPRAPAQALRPLDPQQVPIKVPIHPVDHRFESGGGL